MPPQGSAQQASADPLTLTRRMHIKAAEIERVLRLLARVDVTDDRPRLLGDQKAASRFFNLHVQDRNRVLGIGDFRNTTGTKRGVVGRVPGFDKQTTDRRHIGLDSGADDQCQTQAPCRISGSALPSCVMPSTSTCSEPIIQSTWIRLVLAPRAISASLPVAPPSVKHLL